MRKLALIFLVVAYVESGVCWWFAKTPDKVVWNISARFAHSRNVIFFAASCAIELTFYKVFEWKGKNYFAHIIFCYYNDCLCNQLAISVYQYRSVVVVFTRKAAPTSN